MVAYFFVQRLFVYQSFPFPKQCHSTQCQERERGGLRNLGDTEPDAAALARRVGAAAAVRREQVAVG